MRGSVRESGDEGECEGEWREGTVGMREGEVSGGEGEW